MRLRRFFNGQVFGSALKQQGSSEKFGVCPGHQAQQSFLPVPSGLKMSGSSAERGCQSVPVIFGLAESLNQKCPAGCLNACWCISGKKWVLPVVSGSVDYSEGRCCRTHQAHWQFSKTGVLERLGMFVLRGSR